MFERFHKHEKPLSTNTTDENLVRQAAASGVKITDQVGKPPFNFSPDNVKPAEAKPTPAPEAKAPKPVEDELAGPEHQWADDEVDTIGSPVPPATV